MFSEKKKTKQNNKTGCFCHTRIHTHKKKKMIVPEYVFTLYVWKTDRCCVRCNGWELHTCQQLVGVQENLYTVTFKQFETYRSHERLNVKTGIAATSKSKVTATAVINLCSKMERFYWEERLILETVATNIYWSVDGGLTLEQLLRSLFTVDWE